MFIEDAGVLCSQFTRNLSIHLWLSPETYQQAEVNPDIDVTE